MFIKVTNQYNNICYVQIANISYVETTKIQNEIYATTLALIVFDNKTHIRTQESADTIMQRIAKATKEINK